MCISQLPCQGKDKSISLLLGAGFSAPMGYPTGKQLSERILFCIDCDNYCFFISGDGTLKQSTDGTKPEPYDRYLDLCKDAIHYYNDNIKKFDYEEFYDYLKDNGLEKLFKKGDYDKSKFKQYLDPGQLYNTCRQLDNIYQQLVAFYLKDREGKSWYDDAPTTPTIKGYTGFLHCIKAALSKDYTIHVHTLNHDLFFERLNRTTDGINGELCDGFEELGSPYYGELLHFDRSYKCRLSTYIGKKYNKAVRLYKLHGSIDQYTYYTNKGVQNVATPEACIKTRRGIRNTDFYKERRNKKKILYYENCFINYRPDFLTGTTSKISEYNKEPYKKLFGFFKNNLKNAEILIIIGYGCKDKEINRYILEEFGKEKPCFIVDPYAKQEVYDFISRMGNNTAHVSKEIEKISLSDFPLFKIDIHS